MKCISKIALLSVLCIGIGLISCKSDNYITNAYSNQTEIISIFSNMTLFKRGPIINLYIYHSGMANHYAFKEKEIQIELIRDSTQFNFNDFNRINPNDSTSIQFVKSILMKMELFKIREFESDLRHLGIELMLHFEDNQEMFYVPDLDAVTNPEWRKDILSANKLDDHWYWRSLK